MHLVTSVTDALAGTGAYCGERAGRWKEWPFTVRCVAVCISRPSIPCCPPSNSDWMVDTFAWFFNGFRGWFWSRWPHHIFKGNYPRISSSLEIVLVLRFHLVRCAWMFLELFSPSSVCPNVFRIFRIVWLGHVGDFIKFTALVEFLFLLSGSAQIYRAYCSCLGNRLELAVPVSALVFSSVDPVPFLFLFCLCFSDLLVIDSCCGVLGVGHLFSLGLCNVYICGIVSRHMDG